MICGIRARSPEFPISGPNSALATNVHAVTGVVTQIFPKERDSTLLPFPCFEVNCPSLGGMSGGPAYDENGRLIGLLSTSFLTDDTQGPSYVSQIWPALVQNFEPAWHHQTVAEGFEFKSGGKSIAGEFTDQQLSAQAGSAVFWAWQRGPIGARSWAVIFWEPIDLLKVEVYSQTNHRRSRLKCCALP